MLYFCLYVQLRRGSVAGYTTDESWAYGQKESEEAFESITSKTVMATHPLSSIRLTKVNLAV